MVNEFRNYHTCIVAILLLVVWCTSCTISETPFTEEKPTDHVDTILKDPVFLSADSIWVDSILNTLTLEEKIGQLIMIRAYSNQDAEHVESIKNSITEYNIGGLVFFQGGPKRQAQLCNKYQSLSKIPLLIAMDGEWGLGMRLDSTLNYPYQMTLGAIKDDSLILKMTTDMGQQFRRMGVHWNFAPVVDINNNPNNPVINFRSFGENKFNVTLKSWLYIKGLDSINVLSSLKHFPGHGDTQFDSHKTLPIIDHSFERLEDLELFPFIQLIQKGANSVMVGHLNIPALDSMTNYPTSLSPVIIDELLVGQMGFNGLVVSDAMDMKGLTNYVAKDKAEILALLAGNDIIELVEDVPAALKNVKQAVENGIIPMEIINAKCRKVLQAKYWVGLASYKAIDTKNLINDINDTAYLKLIQKLHQASLTLISNKNNLLEKVKEEGKRIVSVGIGVEKTSVFQQKINQQLGGSNFNVPRFMNRSQYRIIKKGLKKADFVILSLHQIHKRPGFKLDYGKYTRMLIDDIIRNNKPLIFCFRNPYILNQIKNIHQSDFLLVSYQDNHIVQSIASAIFETNTKIDGRLPVSLDHWAEGFGIIYEK